MTNIYILRLEGGKYYVGKSEDVINRYQQHMNGGGSSWTRKYKPISLEKTIENASPFEEDKITKEYMSKYGRLVSLSGNLIPSKWSSDFEEILLPVLKIENVMMVLEYYSPAEIIIVAEHLAMTDSIL
jgi:predicted GIY-YIG superfamily endonuclease